MSRTVVRKPHVSGPVRESLPNGWTWATIGDTGKYINGFAFKPAHRDSSGRPIIRIQNLTDPGKPLNRTTLDVPKNYKVDTGEMLVSWSATVDVFKWDREPALINQHIFRVAPEEALIDKDFLFYWLKVAIDQLLRSEHLHGSTMKHINRAPFMAHKIPLPPRAEQERIAENLEELLSDLDAGVAELKTAQRKLVQYRQSLLKAAVEGTLTADWRATRAQSGKPQETGAELLQRILTERRTRWETRQLAKFAERGETAPKDWKAKYNEPSLPESKDLPTISSSWTWATIEQVVSDERHSLAIGPFGSNLKVSDYREEGVPLVFVRNIRSGNYGGSHTKYITPAKASELSAHGIQPGDVLITKMGEPPGDADVYPDDQPPAVITADCIKVQCERKIMQARFFVAVINSSIGKQQIKPITQGVAQKKVSLGRFSLIAVPLPSLQEQQEICARLMNASKEIDAQSVAVEHSLKQATAQRKNILKAAFTGKLVSQDPNDEHASLLLERIRAERVAADAKRTGKTARKTKERT